MIWLPALRLDLCCQEQPEWQWAGPRDPLEICPFTHQPTPHPPPLREGRTRGCHPTPAEPTPRKHRSRQAAGFLLWAFGSFTFLGERRCLSAARRGRDSLFPSCHHLAPDASVICSCLPESCRPGFSSSEGRYFFFFPESFLDM